MDSKNQYEYAVVAIKQAVEKSGYRVAKVGNAGLMGIRGFSESNIKNMCLPYQPRK